jgi:hypothetical protein
MLPAPHRHQPNRCCYGKQAPAITRQRVLVESVVLLVLFVRALVVSAVGAYLPVLFVRVLNVCGLTQACPTQLRLVTSMVQASISVNEVESKMLHLIKPILFVPTFKFFLRKRISSLERSVVVAVAADLFQVRRVFVYVAGSQSIVCVVIGL